MINLYLCVFRKPFFTMAYADTVMCKNINCLDIVYHTPIYIYTVYYILL